MISKKKIGLTLGPLVFILIQLFFHPPGLSDDGKSILASTLWIAIWWITEAVPISVTALLPIILFPLSGGLDLKSTTAAFGHKFIFLFIGGFVLAIAIEKWGLHKRIALNIIKLVGSNKSNIILGCFNRIDKRNESITNSLLAVNLTNLGVSPSGDVKRHIYR